MLAYPQTSNTLQYDFEEKSEEMFQKMIQNLYGMKNQFVKLLYFE
jgi:hypothetical protein